MKTKTTTVSFFGKALIAGSLLLTATMLQPSMAQTSSYTDRLSRVGLFEPYLLWVGGAAPAEAESEELWQTLAIDQRRTLDQQSAKAVESFIQAHPNSAWLPSLHSHLGAFYRKAGYFTLSLNHWEAAWSATKEKSDLSARQVADYTLANWLHLLASLGRTETMKVLFDATRDRMISEPFVRSYNQSRDAYGMMLNRPDLAYRCGTYALNAVAQALCGTNTFHDLLDQSSPKTGFSMASLEDLPTGIICTSWPWSGLRALSWLCPPLFTGSRTTTPPLWKDGRTLTRLSTPPSRWLHG
ncbi:MAG TPA: hypothetical protein VNZ64_26020 [Candidatus Acidoferrum sp.]|jgi:hypothetical protein|nr:hypothetical protein [Candidatus Acidoferrum sp.]